MFSALFNVLFGGSANAFVFVIDGTNDVIKHRVDWDVYLSFTPSANRTVQLIVKTVVPSV